VSRCVFIAPRIVFLTQKTLRELDFRRAALDALFADEKPPCKWARELFDERAPDRGVRVKSARDSG
jgi:hypothetical protein